MKYFIWESTNDAYKGTVVFMFGGILLPPFDRDKRLPTSNVPTSSHEFVTVGDTELFASVIVDVKYACLSTR